jgi:hypothetical protein
MRTALQPRTYDKEGLRAGDREEPVNLAAVWPTRHRNQFSRTALRARPSVPQHLLGLT